MLHETVTLFGAHEAMARTAPDACSLAYFNQVFGAIDQLKI